MQIINVTVEAKPSSEGAGLVSGSCRVSGPNRLGPDSSDEEIKFAEQISILIGKAIEYHVRHLESQSPEIARVTIDADGIHVE